jgi:hypothetical protein
MGLMLAGPLIERWGFQTIMTTYAVIGMALTLALAWRWRQALWHDDKPI